MCARVRLLLGFSLIVLLALSMIILFALPTLMWAIGLGFFLMVPLALSTIILFSLTTLMFARLRLLSDCPSGSLGAYTFFPHGSDLG